MANDVFEDMIREREQRMELLKAEIKVLREAQSLSQGSKPSKTGSTRERALKPMWADILYRIGNTSENKLDDIQTYADLRGYKINPHTMRGQLAVYVKSGLLNRISPGVFSLTMAGAEKCGHPSASAIKTIEYPLPFLPKTLHG